MARERDQTGSDFPFVSAEKTGRCKSAKSLIRALSTILLLRESFLNQLGSMNGKNLASNHLFFSMNKQKLFLLIAVVAISLAAVNRSQARVFIGIGVPFPVYYGPSYYYGPYYGSGYYCGGYYSSGYYWGPRGYVYYYRPYWHRRWWYRHHWYYR
jgi:hypothetical protein